MRIRFGLSFDDVLLVPNLTSLFSRKLADVSTHFTRKIKLHIPIVSANVPWCTEWRMAAMMAKLGGLGIIHRMTTLDREALEVQKVKSAEFTPAIYPNAMLDKQGRLLVGAAVGVKGDYRERAERLVHSGADLILVDIAHGHSNQALRAIETLRRVLPRVDIVAGNVATCQGASDLIRAGADAVKVGIGPGAICSTRIVTGCGVPQITAIMDCVQYAKTYNIPVIADGGIRTSGDITKALAAGASSVMLGSMLAGAEESSARLVSRGSRKYKITTGFVTLGMELTLRKAAAEQIEESELKEYVPEGVEATFEYAGKLEEIIVQCLGGLRSGMSYCGARSISELWKKASFIQISPSGFLEGTPHALKRVEQVHPDYRKRFLAEMVTASRDRTTIQKTLRTRASA